MSFELAEESEGRWRIAPFGSMRVPGVVFSSSALLPASEKTGRSNRW